MANRRDRRAERAKARKGRDTMGASYSVGPLPAHVQNHPAFRAGVKAAESGTGFPPEYHEAIRKAAELIASWVKAQPTMPDLRWIPQRTDGVFVAAGLDVGARFLADSPDAFALLAWIDEKMDRKLSLNQATWALRLCRALPMPDGSYYGVTTTHESEAHRSLLQMLKRAYDSDESDRIISWPCAHCGKMLDGASHADGHKPRPGDLSVCVYCAGALQFDDELHNRALGEAEIESMDPKVRARIQEMQALLRSAIAKRQRKGPVPEA